MAQASEAKPHTPSEATRRVLAATLVRPAKTDVRITVMEHLSHVVQVALHLTAEVGIEPRERNRVCLAAALHDLGKAVTRPNGERWYHATESAALVDDVLKDPLFRGALEEAGLDLDLTGEELDRVCDLVARHHGLGAESLLHTPSAVLMVLADAIASALEEGWCGSIPDILAGRPIQSTGLALAEACGWGRWLETAIRKIEFPTDTISDLLLAERVITALTPHIEAAGLQVVMRDAGTVWLGGEPASVEALLEHEIAVEDILDTDLLGEVYDRPGAPRVPTYSVESLEYLLLNDRVACSVLQSVFESAGDAKKRVLEDHGLTWDVLTAGRTIEEVTDPETLTQLLYGGIRARLATLSTEAGRLVPESVESLIALPRREGEARLREAADCVARDNPDLPRTEIDVIRKAITVNNAGRSVVNVWLARAAQRDRVLAREVAFRLADVASLDGRPLASDPPPIARNRQKYSAPCAACPRGTASIQATTLIMGATEGDGMWSSAGVRKKPRICAWCHMAGITDLPLVSVRKRGTRHVRETNYLMVTSVLSRTALLTALRHLGLLTGEAVAIAEREIAGTEDHTLSADDEDLLGALFGEVPEPTSVLGVVGLLDGLSSRGVNAILLPGRTPLATRCVFALPSAAFFGFHRTGDMNQEVMDVVSAGVMSVLRRHLGPSTFTLRATSSRAAVTLRSSRLGDADLAWAEAAWSLAEIRRKTAFHVPGLQDPDSLDTGFVLRLTQDPRAAAAGFLRDLRRTAPPGTNALADRIAAHVREMDRARPCPVTGFLQSTTRRLVRAGLIEAGKGLVRRTATGWTARSEGGMTGALLDLWRVGSEEGFDHWLDTLTDRAPEAIGEITQIRGDLHRLRADAGTTMSHVLRRFNAEAVLLVLEATSGAAGDEAFGATAPVRVP